jgi:hypothetical protein
MRVCGQRKGRQQHLPNLAVDNHEPRTTSRSDGPFVAMMAGIETAFRRISFPQVEDVG